MKKILEKLLCILLLLAGLAYADTLPKGYYDYRDTLYSEVHKYMPNFYVPPYFGSMIEHESCISLTHSKCWNPKARLKTPREEGGGLSQMTRAYKADGSLRFDILSDLVVKYPKDLKGLNWNTLYDRPDLQIRAMVLLWRSNWNLFINKDIDYWSMIAFSDSAYNGGYSHVYKDMQICKLKKNCNQKIWFDNVEKESVKSKKILYGNRSAYDINRHHVRDVLLNRLDKYVVDWSNSGMYLKYKIE